MVYYLYGGDTMGNKYNAYDLFFSNITTPLNLLENYKLENYEYVKYYKNDSMTVCEMQCEVDDVSTIFYYHFENDSLKIIEREQYGDRELLFDRESEKMKFINDQQEKRAI